MILTTQQKELLKKAEDAAKNAYVPASGFRVGAALECGGGTYTGCNIENSSLGLSICAERVAVFKAVSAGERVFTAMAVTNEAGGDAPPCGACRQVLAEFAPGLPVTYRHNGELVTRALDDLLPDGFDWKGDSGG